jgi:amylosucrase
VTLLDSAGARAQLVGQVEARDVDIFLCRLEQHGADLLGPLRCIYGHQETFERWFDELLRLLVDRYASRPEPLKLLDLRRELDRDWLLSERQLGYVCYADRFAGSLAGVHQHLDHLAELGVTYLHLMPLLAPRPGNSDGGYAVADFDRVDPRLGSMQDLEFLATALRERGISLCIDLVLNHVAKEHVWAQRARSGDARYVDYFWTFPDREQPDRFEATLPEVFPSFAPGNFCFDEKLERWVWTTFNDFQWDLRWENPAVFLELLEVILSLAARGVEVLRLDAIAFIWKRLGTDCQNQPEVHQIVRALGAATRIVAPAVAFKAEAIVAPEQLVAYLGCGEHHGKLSQLAYHNTLMVQIWSALATRDTRLARRALTALPDKPDNTAWATYLRCHDDIGWAIDDRHAADVGWSGPAHRRFLADYYLGTFPGSHSRGELFQDNPRTGDRRSCGTTASLMGLEQALEQDDPRAVELAIERILLGHAIIFAFGGVPLIYMGDEVGLLNDLGYRQHPDRRDDNRWIHRPAMPWSQVCRRHQAGTVEQRIFDGLRALAAARQRSPQLDAGVPTQVLDAGDDRLLAFARPHPEGRLVALFNLGEAPVVSNLAALAVPAHSTDLLHGEAIDGPLELGPYGRRWLV